MRERPSHTPPPHLRHKQIYGNGTPEDGKTVPTKEEIAAASAVLFESWSPLKASGDGCGGGGVSSSCASLQNCRCTSAFHIDSSSRPCPPTDVYVCMRVCILCVGVQPWLPQYQQLAETSSEKAAAGVFIFGMSIYHGLVNVGLLRQPHDEGILDFFGGFEEACRVWRRYDYKRDSALCGKPTGL